MEQHGEKTKEYKKKKKSLYEIRKSNVVTIISNKRRLKFKR